MTLPDHSPDAHLPEHLRPFFEPTQVLDQGHVRLIDVMGDDSAVVQAARVSYGKGTTTAHEDEGLIRYLMRHRHTSPFEMCEIKFHVRVPMDTWRQWIRHRTASVNEYSTRYSEAIDAMACTSPQAWRTQSKTNKQGSSADVLPMDIGEWLSDRETNLHELAEEVYAERLQHGVARELARKDLPLSNYTEAYWKIDLHNLLHFLGLRLDAHAQLEIRSYAGVIAGIVGAWVPMVWGAFLDYRLHARIFSRQEIAVLQQVVADFCAESGRDPILYLGGLLQRMDVKSKRERGEFLRALGVIGVAS